MPSDSKWLPKMCFVHITETERSGDLKCSTNTRYDSMDIMSPINHITIHSHSNFSKAGVHLNCTWVMSRQAESYVFDVQEDYVSY